MKKKEILRGRSTFKAVVLEGKRLYGTLLRCSYLIEHSADATLQVSFKASSRNFNAVRRNRVKRLMREGFSLEKSVLEAEIEKRNLRVAIIFFYNGERKVSVERLKMSMVREDIGSLCRSIASRL